MCQAMSKTIAILFLLTISVIAASNMVRLSQVETLTLYRGKWTTYQRSESVPQIRCVGGNAAGVFEPDVVQCYNRGSDGFDVQWECKAEMSPDYRFGRIMVNCESDRSDPNYVLKGSCGLEYELEYTGNEQHGDRTAHRQSKHTESSSINSGMIFAGIVVLFIVYILYKTLSSDGNNAPDRTGRRPGDGGNGPGGYPPPPPPHDDYRQPPPAYDDVYGSGGKYRTQSTAPPPPQQQGAGNFGGFWTGLGLGGLGGYLFGNRRQQTGYQRYDRGPSQFEQNTGFYDRATPSAPPAAASSSSETRTTSGFGGTRRR